MGNVPAAAHPLGLLYILALQALCRDGRTCHSIQTTCNTTPPSLILNIWAVVYHACPNGPRPTPHGLLQCSYAHTPSPLFLLPSPDLSSHLPLLRQSSSQPYHPPPSSSPGAPVGQPSKPNPAALASAMHLGHGVGLAQPIQFTNAIWGFGTVPPSTVHTNLSNVDLCPKIAGLLLQLISSGSPRSLVSLDFIFLLEKSLSICPKLLSFFLLLRRSSCISTHDYPSSNSGDNLDSTSFILAPAAGAHFP